MEPVLEAVRPGVVVEIGAERGLNTLELLGFCERTGARLHVVDPAPQYDVSELEQRYGPTFVFHQKLSLEALEKIEAPDAVLIDGDHNYYTVINELRLLERRGAAASKPFPLVMLHDIGWPYGRRDLYYDPQTIPAEHRQPHAQRGMHPASKELLEEGGLSRQLDNALHEGGPENGVLTAIEDFMEETERALELIRVPGLHELGILAPPVAERGPELEAALRSVEPAPVAARHMERIEAERMRRMISEQDLGGVVQMLRQKVTEINQSIQEERQEKKSLRAEKEDLRAEKKDLRAEKESLRAEKEILQAEKENLQAEKKGLQAEKEQQEEEVRQISRWLRQLDEEVAELLESRQWRIGQSLGELYRRASRTPPVTTAADSARETLDRFRDWDRSRDEPGSEADITPDGKPAGPKK